MGVTYKHIARVAKVSPGTVSNALNNRRGLAEETRRKIISIATEMGYKKEGPRTSSSFQNVKFVIFKKSGVVVTDTPFFATLMEAIDHECKANHHEVTISHFKDGVSSIRGLNLDDKHLKGVIVLATELAEEDMRVFSAIPKPVVFVDAYFGKYAHNYVGINNYHAAYCATGHLIEKGHMRLGHMASSLKLQNFFYRRMGFLDALIGHGLSFDPKNEIFITPSLNDSYKDMIAILKEHRRRFPTAFFIDNDIIAFGAIRALKEHGIRIAQDVSLVSFDDMPFCQNISPRLSSVRLHPRLIGELAVRRLIEIMRGDQTPINIEVGTHLMVRESVLDLTSPGDGV